MSIELLLKDGRAADLIKDAIAEHDQESEDGFIAIRCPLCSWRPAPSSRWSCVCEGTPEPHFEGCGTVWNTFSTRGRCPGCGHQWLWTTCLRCGQPSLHEDWYEEESRD
jgi:DNA-directed RNA polymerase subunit RPC12/RpoP